MSALTTSPAPNWRPTSCCAAAAGGLAGSTTHLPPGPGACVGEAFSRALQARGVDVERNLAILACPEEGYTGGFQAAALADEALEGIFCANAQIACGFLDGMRQRGKQAPEDYQLIGFDNTPPTAQYSYQLTTLHQDVAAISRQTLARLQERTVDPLQPSRTTWVEVTLIHRRTSPFII